MGSSSTLPLENFLLYLNQLTNAAAAEIQKLVQSLKAKWKPFGCSLDLDELVSIGHDDIEIDVGRRVLRIIQVEHWNSINDTHANGRDM